MFGNVGDKTVDLSPVLEKVEFPSTELDLNDTILSVGDDTIDLGPILDSVVLPTPPPVILTFLVSN